MHSLENWDRQSQPGPFLDGFVEQLEFAQRPGAYPPLWYTEQLLQSPPHSSHSPAVARHATSTGTASQPDGLQPIALPLLQNRDHEKA